MSSMLKFEKSFGFNWTMKDFNNYLKANYDKYFKCNYDWKGYIKEWRNMLKMLKNEKLLKLDGKNLMVFAVASQLFLSGCATMTSKYKYSKKADVLVKIDKKIEDNTLTFEDVFETNYGEYAEKTEQTEEELDALVLKYKQYVNGVKTFGGTIKLDADKILLDNIDKVAEIMVDKNNFKHGIYGSNEKQWFKKDTNEKVPLNYFQQQFLSQADKKTLRDISLKIVDKIFNDDKEHIMSIGILWCVFGNGYQLKEAFERLNFYIDECKKSVDSGKVLTKKQVKFLNELKQGQKNISNIKTDGIDEYFSKVSVKKKFEVLLKDVDSIFEKHKVNSKKAK